jgi:DNA-binding Lrp family transcriptional regulator
MVTAIILLNVRRNAVNETAEALLNLKGITEVYSIAGQWDLVAIARVKTNDQLADVVTNHLLKIDGIEKTNTLIAFQAFSKLDLVDMFPVE